MFGCPSTCSGHCENVTPSHEVQQLLSEAAAATAAIALMRQLQQHTQSMGCTRATAESRSPPLLVSFPLKGLIHAFTSFSFLISIGQDPIHSLTKTEGLTFCPSDDVDALASTDSCLYVCGCVCTRNHNIWQWEKKQNSVHETTHQSQSGAGRCTTKPLCLQCSCLSYALC